MFKKSSSTSKSQQGFQLVSIAFINFLLSISVLSISVLAYSEPSSKLAVRQELLRKILIRRK